MSRPSIDAIGEIATLREQLAEAEELLRAIRGGEVDAIVVDGRGAPAVYTLKSASDTYRLIVEQMSEGALTVSSDGIILYCNAAFARMAGRTRERLTGTLLTALVADDGTDKLARLYADTAGGTLSITLKDAEGANIPAQISSTPIMIEEESVHCLVVTDLSRQEMLAQAEKLSALGLLAGGVAHDFNNIVQGVAGCASLIGRYAGDPAKVAKYAQMLEDAAWRGASITRRLLALARRDELRTESVDMRLLLEDLRSMLTHMLGPNITIQLDLAPDLAPVLADKSQLEAVLVNLATNSRDAMQDGGTITFSAAMEEVAGPHPADLRPGAYLRLAVADDGAGMDAATLKRAVEPFFTTKPPGRGTGLGLSMARGFAEQSEGTLTVASEPERGTVVTLWLPAAVASVRTAVASQGLNALATGTPRILLVDDENVIREVLTRELTDRGYHVILAESGAGALALLDEGEQVDMLVTDLSMPGMDGVTLIGAVQQRHPLLPAILLTGYAGEATTLAIGNKVDGPATLLRKPVSGAQLADNVAMMLAATATFQRHSE
jgi:PAS domain S-box-containing protein